MSRLCTRTLIWLGFVGTIAASATAANLSPGDILVADNAAAAVVLVDPGDGSQAVISAGGLLVGPVGIALEAAGTILVTNHGGGVHNIVRIDPASGAQSVVSADGLLSAMREMRVDRFGRIFVARTGAAIVRVDACSGAQTLVASGAPLADPHGLAFASDGLLFVADQEAFSAGAVFGVDISTGVATEITRGGLFNGPVFGPGGLLVEASGDLLVANESPGRIVRVDPGTGAQSLVADGGLLGGTTGPFGMAFDEDGKLVVALRAALSAGNGGVIRIDLGTGQQEIVSVMQAPHGLVIVPDPVPRPGPSDDGLIAHYPFAGNAADATGSGHDGVVDGAQLTVDRFGRVDHAFLFDGVDDSITAPASPSLDISNVGTACAWVRPERKSGDLNNFVVGKFRGDTNSEDGWEILMNQFSDRYEMFVEIKADNGAVSKPKTPFPALPEWHHVCLVKEAGNAASLYFDGGFVTTGPTLGSTSGNSRPLMIGGQISSSNSLANFFKGTIDDIRIYDRMLSCAEIEDLFDEQEPNQPPVADAGPDQTVAAGMACTADVNLSGADSTEPDGDELSFTWRDADGNSVGNEANITVEDLPLGEHTFTLEVDDGRGGTASDDVVVTVVDQTAPELSLIGDNPLIHEVGAAFVDPGAEASDDCDGDMTTAIVATSDVDEFVVGSYTISYFVEDAAGNSNGMTRVVNVVDTTAPEIVSVVANPGVLWPPNHKMVEVQVTVDASDNSGDAPNCSISGVTSSEPVNGPGDGNTAPDWLITGELTVELRAERAGGGPGRTYTIEVSCVDAAGNQAMANALVQVPHDQGGGKGSGRRK